MELTKEQKKYGARLSMALMLFDDVKEKKYEKLQKICEIFNLTNEKVIKKIKQTEKVILPIPSEQIFYDWMYAIYDESEHNELVVDEIFNLHNKNFPQVLTLFKEIEKNYSENKLHQCQNIIQKILKNKMGYGMASIILLLCYSDIINDFEIIGIDFELCICAGEQILFASETKQDEYQMTFNTGEQIITSSQYKKYLKARRTELAEYMSKLFNEKITETNLGRVLDKMLASKATNKGVPIDYSLGGVVDTACKRILIEHGGGLDWYEAITNRNGSSFPVKLNYMPDVDGIIEQYYLQLMRYINNKEGELSKVYLIRECKSESPLIDLISIMFMYNIDVFSKMITNLLEDYYKSFSWEKVVNQNITARYDSIITALKDDIQSMKNSLESSNMKMQILNEQLRKEKGAEIIPLERAATEFTKKIEEKDKEIENLKQQIRSKDEFIELLESTDDQEVPELVDISVLQTKKYLFVGHIKEALPELYRKFPNSLFMENENFSLLNIKVDGIIMLIKYMSHGMYYKIRSTNSLSNIPIVKCNTKNINIVYNAMKEAIKEN